MVGKMAPIKYEKLEIKCSGSNKKKISFIIKDIQDMGNIMVSITEFTAFKIKDYEIQPNLLMMLNRLRMTLFLIFYQIKIWSFKF